MPIALRAAKDSDIDNDLDLVWMLQFLDEVQTNETDYRDESQRWRRPPHGDFMVVGYAPAYDDLTWLCLGCRGESLGQVYYVAPYLMEGFPDLSFVTANFVEFIGLLGTRRSSV